MYMIKHEQAREMFAQIDAKLSNVEVKGESVGNLFAARMMLKELFNSLEEIKDENKLGKEG